MDSPNDLDLKNQSPEEIRGQIDQTRDGLGDKLGALGDKMEDAKSAVQEKMEEVREKLSLSHRVQQNPWTAFFGAVGVGMLAGHMLSATSRPEPIRQESAGPGIGAGILSMVSGSALGGLFDQEIKSALTSAVQAIWGEARSSVPPTIAGPVDRLIDRMALRQGGFSHLGSLRG